jgi:hypothetical protein
LDPTRDLFITGVEYLSLLGMLARQQSFLPIKLCVMKRGDMKMVALIAGTASRTNASGPGAHHSAVPQSPCATQGIREHLAQ